MRLQRLRLHNFRIVKAADLELDARVNLFAGDNGAGKSSLLEAVINLSRGRVSDGHPRERAGLTGSEWSVEAVAIANEMNRPSVSNRLRMDWRRGLELSLNAEVVTARTLSRQISVAAVDPRSHDLFDFGPTQRRRFLDWALFHVEPRYADRWSYWRRILGQRNKALSLGESEAAVQAWNPSLTEAVTEIEGFRQRSVQAISIQLQSMAKILLDARHVDVIYDSGWDSEQSYFDVLIAAVEGDRRHGRTRYGPQRADLQVTIDGQSADQLSRGQQKLLITGLMLAASQYLAEQRGEWPILAIDDFESELGVAALERLSTAVAAYPGQSLITQHDAAGPLVAVAKPALFHVEHGNIRRAIQ